MLDQANGALEWEKLGLQKGLHSTLWFGSEGCYTPCHQDSYVDPASGVFHLLALLLFAIWPHIEHSHQCSAREIVVFPPRMAVVLLAINFPLHTIVSSIHWLVNFLMCRYGYNMVAQILGEKRWVLFPPTSTSKLYPTRLPYEESSIFSSVNVKNPDYAKRPQYISKLACRHYPYSLSSF